MTTEDKIEIQYLLSQYLDGRITAAQATQLSAYLQQYDADAAWLDLLEELMMAEEALQTYSADEWQAYLDDLKHKMRHADAIQDEPAPRIIFLRKWRWIAASLVFVLSVATLFLLRTPSANKVLHYAQDSVDVQPGRNGALLTLSNGETVLLDSFANGTVAVQNGAKVLLQNGRLVYDPVSLPASEIAYNTVRTPLGRQYQLQLPDGTDVWLNAGSSIRYPTSFTGGERKVEVTGEVYFEVTSRPRSVFLVAIANRATVEVLGTHFNIMAYQNEQEWQTTLLEGKVKFAKGDASVMLQPGQQGRLLESGKLRVAHNVDVQTVVAWKNGLQSFRGADLKALMRQIERWYNITVIFKGDPPNRTFSGDIPRSAGLAELLKLFEINNIHFEFDKAKQELTIIP